MTDVATTILTFFLSPNTVKILIDAVKIKKKPQREELCYTLTIIFYTIQELIKLSEQFLNKLSKAKDPVFCAAASKDQIEIAKVISDSWKSLWDLFQYMHIVDPVLANNIRYAFGGKLNLLYSLSETSNLLSQKSNEKTLKLLRKINFGSDNLSYSAANIESKTLTDLQESGFYEIDTVDPWNDEQIRCIISSGEANIIKLKELRDNLRQFMLASFDKEDFFFSKARH